MAAPHQKMPSLALRAGIIASLPVLAAGCKLWAVADSTLLEWAARETATYLYVDWHLGPIRRSGLGLATAAVSNAPPTDTWGLVVWGIALLAAVIAVAATVWSTARKGAWSLAWVMTCWAISPFGMPLLVANTAPFDALLVALLPVLLRLLCAVNHRTTPTPAPLWVIIGLLPVATLLHEFMLFWAAPVVIASIGVSRPSIWPLRRAVLALLPSGLLLALLLGAAPDATVTQRLFTAAEMSPAPVVRGLLAERAAPGMVLGVLRDVSAHHLGGFLVAAALLVPMGIAAACFARRAILVVAPLCAMGALAALAVDWTRWFTLAVWVTLLLVAAHGPRRKRLPRPVAWALVVALGCAWTVAFNTDPYQGAAPVGAHWDNGAANPVGPPP